MTQNFCYKRLQQWKGYVYNSAEKAFFAQILTYRFFRLHEKRNLQSPNVITYDTRSDR